MTPSRVDAGGTIVIDPVAIHQGIADGAVTPGADISVHVKSDGTIVMQIVAFHGGVIGTVRHINIRWPR